MQVLQQVSSQPAELPQVLLEPFQRLLPSVRRDYHGVHIVKVAQATQAELTVQLLHPLQPQYLASVLLQVGLSLLAVELIQWALLDPPCELFAEVGLLPFLHLYAELHSPLYGRSDAHC